jgi:hypothetical protein
MQSSMDRRVVLALGAAAAVLAAVVIALVLSGRGDRAPQAPPASKAGLQLDIAEAPPADLQRELRCFVDGRFVGTATLAQCAERNGVSAQALDVGIDPETGSLAAAQTASLAPPPELPAEVLPEDDGPVEHDDAPVTDTPRAEPAPMRPAAGPGGSCWRHTGSDWRQLSASMSLNACVQALFSGQCERPGGATYGRWGDMTLRLVPGRVEQSGDNRSFRRLAPQGRNCSIPEIG